jgi:hypothetical protein
MRGRKSEIELAGMSIPMLEASFPAECYKGEESCDNSLALALAATVEGKHTLVC